MTPTRLLGDFLWPRLGDGVAADQLAADVLRLLDEKGLLLNHDRTAKIRADEAEQCAQAIDAHARWVSDEMGGKYNEAHGDGLCDAAIIVRRRIPEGLRVDR